MSLLELLNMLSTKEGMGDIYFYSGMVVAGVIGIIGLFVSQAKDIGGAITSGIAAPQLLGGLAKSATNIGSQTAAFGKTAEIVLCFLMAPFGGDAYAATPDSVTIKTVVKSQHALEVKTNGRSQYVKDTTDIKVAADDTLNIEGQKVSVADYTVDKNKGAMMVTIEKKNRVVVSKKGQLLRGLFGHQEVYPATAQRQDVQIQVQQLDAPEETVAEKAGPPEEIEDE